MRTAKKLLAASLALLVGLSVEAQVVRGRAAATSAPQALILGDTQYFKNPELTIGYGTEVPLYEIMFNELMPAAFNTWRNNPQIVSIFNGQNPRGMTPCNVAGQPAGCLRYSWEAPCVSIMWRKVDHVISLEQFIALPVEARPGYVPILRAGSQAQCGGRTPPPHLYLIIWDGITTPTHGPVVDVSNARPLSVARIRMTTTGEARNIPGVSEGTTVENVFRRTYEDYNAAMFELAPKLHDFIVKCGDRRGANGWTGEIDHDVFASIRGKLWGTTAASVGGGAVSMTAGGLKIAGKGGVVADVMSGVGAGAAGIAAGIDYFTQREIAAFMDKIEACIQARADLKRSVQLSVSGGLAVYTIHSQNEFSGGSRPITIKVKPSRVSSYDVSTQFGQQAQR
ncbi:MAG: hypothetical protein FWD15_04955 [Alphaproteobacteria bacterium]|nr:hypothetical protein [Alphaproteobacteria bacterium]